VFSTKYLYEVYNETMKSRGGSVGIETGWTIGVRFPARAGNFSLRHRVQNGSGAHPASYQMGTEGLFAGALSGQVVNVTFHFHLVLKSKNAWRYTSIPQYIFMALCLVKHRATLPYETVDDWILLSGQ
jgi:hypothetical protein